LFNNHARNYLEATPLIRANILWHIHLAHLLDQGV